MSPSTSTTQLELTKKEVRILVQSLGNCIDTCRTHEKNPNAPCEDCDAARALKAKLEKHAKA
jgi:hypothetical protein